MSRTDEELAKALQDAEATAAHTNDPGAAMATPAAQSTAEPPKRHLGLLIALLVMGGVLLTLVLTNFDNAAIYSIGVDQLAAQKDQLGDRNLRVDGKLVSGTLAKRTTPCEYRFRIEKNGSELEVHYPQCIVPDTFRDVKGVDVLVTAEGKLHSDGYLLASQIFAKCPSKYEMKQIAEQSGMDVSKGMDPLVIQPKVVDNY
jgi:cytochrome c-type biogenesis protein CcmE